MSEQRNNRHSVVPWAVAVVVLLMLYVLSVGPVAWLHYHGFISEDGRAYDALKALYSPLAWVHGRSEQFAKMFDWYIGLWIDIP